MDNPAQNKTRVLARAVGFSSERARRLWWYVHNAAHQRCGRDFGCEREHFFGHQIMFMVRGRGEGTYRGEPWKAARGQAVLMDLRRRHGYRAEPRDPWEMYWIRFDGPGVAAVFDALLQAAGSPVMPFASPQKLRADFRAIVRLLAEHPPGYDAWVWRHLSGLVANVVEGLRRAASPAGARWDARAEHAPEGIAAALAFLRNHHQRPLSVAELARSAHMSPYHFIRRFKEASGFTPMEYLEKFRIGRAQELILERPELRLNEIARSVGYPDAAYFSRVFKKRAGVPPRAYRRHQPG